MTWKHVATAPVLVPLPLVVGFVEFQSAGAATASFAKASPQRNNRPASPKADSVQLGLLGRQTEALLKAG